MNEFFKFEQLVNTLDKGVSIVDKKKTYTFRDELSIKTNPQKLYDEFLTIPRFKRLNLPTVLIAYVYIKNILALNLDTDEDNRVFLALMAVYDNPALKGPLDTNSVQFIKYKTDILRYVIYLNSIGI